MAKNHTANKIICAKIVYVNLLMTTLGLTKVVSRNWYSG